MSHNYDSAQLLITNNTTVTKYYDSYIIGQLTGTITVTLDATPFLDDTIIIKDGYGIVSTYNVTNLW